MNEMTSLLRRTALCSAGIAFALALTACSSDKGDKTPSGETGDDGGGSTPSGSVKLITCDGTHESSAKPITDACGTFISPNGVTVKLGPYGGAMDVNMGKGFENVDPMDQASCPAFVNLFMEDATLSTQLLDDGPQPCTESTPNTGTCLNMSLYSVYHPANWPAGKIPVLTWGNGTCAQPEGYGTLLRYIASYGFFVVAANSREVGTGDAQKKAIDYATAANADPSSPYYGHLDLTKVGAMGHSQGGSATVAATNSDPRITSAIIFNGGDALTVSTPYLAISGDLDVTGYTAATMASAINAATGPAAYLYYHNPVGNMADTIRGHLVLMLSPDRVGPQSVAWWQMSFNGDAKAKAQFSGTTCGLCSSATDFDYGQHGL
ncbi:MAG TPA: hypothetical protein VH062_07870 [Polyangiaceae bacterium]|jgi:hypothetical protein|nr:hypothetical protein [Polyangiaceae bacterium]